MNEQMSDTDSGEPLVIRNRVIIGVISNKL